MSRKSFKGSFERDPFGAAPGSYGRRQEGGTALQQHSAFFDRDGDGVITLKETYDGCRAIGLGRLFSGYLAITINGLLGWATSSPPRPTLRIRLDRIHRGKHGSDTDIYDQEGNFDPERFERLFARYDRDGDGCLNIRELWRRARGDRDLFDFFGQIATIGEFALTYYIAAENGKLCKDTLRAMYDGSLFYQLEERQRQARRRRRSRRQ